MAQMVRCRTHQQRRRPQEPPLLGWQPLRPESHAQLLLTHPRSQRPWPLVRPTGTPLRWRCQRQPPRRRRPPPPRLAHPQRAAAGWRPCCRCRSVRRRGEGRGCRAAAERGIPGDTRLACKCSVTCSFYTGQLASTPSCFARLPSAIAMERSAAHGVHKSIPTKYSRNLVCRSGEREPGQSLFDSHPVGPGHRRRRSTSPKFTRARPEMRQSWPLTPLGFTCARRLVHARAPRFSARRPEAVGGAPRKPPRSRLDNKKTLATCCC
jgi:hypothetical protein